MRVRPAAGLNLCDSKGPLPRLDLWYGEPLSAEEAERLAQRQRRRQSQLTTALIGMRLNHHHGESIEGDYRALIAVTRSGPKRARALVELLYGALQISCRRPGAIDALRRGERIASRLLEPGRWIALVERHDRLALLRPLQPTPPPMPLVHLLAEAAVIKRLGGAGRPPAIAE